MGRGERRRREAIAGREKQNVGLSRNGRLSQENARGGWNIRGPEITDEIESCLAESWGAGGLDQRKQERDMA
jgi:hypothetical protein